jgi:hypothetical protein
MDYIEIKINGGDHIENRKELGSDTQTAQMDTQSDSRVVS